MSATEADGPEMRVSFQVAYENADDAHAMDVRLLAPALMAFGEIIRESNYLISGSKSKVNLNVISDFERKCFNINFEMVQSIYVHIKTTLGIEEVKAAKEILEWLGILRENKEIAGTAAVSLLGYFGIRRGRKVTSVNKVEDEDSRGMVRVEFGEGAHVGHVEVHHHVYNLGESRKIRNAIAGALQPIQPTGPFEKLEFRRKDKPVDSIPQSEVANILATCESPAEGEIDQPLVPHPVEAWLKILAPVLEEDAKSWRFYYGETPIRADISETDIAKRAIARGGVTVGDTYKVKMLITQHMTPTHQFRNSYKVTEVLEFHPAKYLPQGSLI